MGNPIGIMFFIFAMQKDRFGVLKKGTPSKSRVMIEAFFIFFFIFFILLLPSTRVVLQGTLHLKTLIYNYILKRIITI